MANGPEDQVIEDLWTGAQPRGLFRIQVGEVAIPMTHWLVWFPYLVLLMIGGIGLIVFLPTELADDFLAYSFGWIGLFRGDLSVATFSSLLGVVVVLVITFFVYTQLLKATLGWLMERQGP